MAAEPQRKIEEALTAYAHKRRAQLGASVELEPGTRRLLQAEVKRRLDKPHGEGSASVWGAWRRFWPQISFAVSVLVLVGALAWLRTSRPAVAPTFAKYSPPAPVMEITRDQDLAQVIQPQQPPQASVKNKENRVLDAPSAAPILKIPALDEVKGLNRKPKEVEQHAPVHLAAPPTRGRFENSGEAGISGKQRYLQQATPAQRSLGGQTAGAAPVLNQFDWENVGERVRITDADGSIYEGRIVAAPPTPSLALRGLAKEQKTGLEVAETAGQARAVSQFQANSAIQNMNSPLYFRAFGTNRSLNQAVSIEAALVPTPTQIAGQAGHRNTAPTGTSASSAYNLRPSAPQTTALQQYGQQTMFYANTKIQGKAQVGATNEVAIDAEAMAPGP